MQTTDIERIKSTFSQMGNQESRFDSLYRRAAASFGLTQCEMWIYYFLLLAPGEVTQYTVSSQMAFPKQTVNSAVARLATAGMVQLRQDLHDRKRKTLSLTPAGLGFAQKTVQRLVDAELSAAQHFGSEKLMLLNTLRKEYYELLEEVFENGILTK